MRAAAGAGGAAVELEFARGESGLGGGFVDVVDLAIVGGPVFADREIDLDDTRVGCEADGRQARIKRWRVAGEDDVLKFLGNEDGFERGDELDLGFEKERWNEERDCAVFHFDGEGAA